MRSQLYLLILLLQFTACKSQVDINSAFLIGNQRTEIYFPKLKGKEVGVICNHTSYLNNVHLIDTLLSSDVKVSKIFAPEHGFRGNSDAGELIDSKIDQNSGLPLISLYGKNKKPLPDQLEGLDIIVFDIQDVGVRFYTYISTLHYVMEACAENDVSLIVLDRPNPNGDYIDGPVLDTTKCKSFVGMHPIPIIYGMTIGEIALMINGEGWLKNQVHCKLEVIKLDGYKRNENYSLKIKPSPNLPNDISVRLYPSLCFFEATPISIGRGTTYPFQVIGYPNPQYGNFSFTPVSIDGMSKYPKLKDKACFGIDLRSVSPRLNFTLKYLMNFYNVWEEDVDFFERRKWFNLLAGNEDLLKQIEKGWTENQIRTSWSNTLNDFKMKRKKYLLYAD